MKELLIRIDELQTLNKQLTEDHIKNLKTITDLKNKLFEKDETITQQLRTIDTLRFETNYANSVIVGMHKEIQELNLKLFSQHIKF